MPTAKGRKLPTVMGAPSSRSSGSPPGSSSMSMLPPRSRSSARGRTAHAPSNTSFKPYSWARLSRQLGLGCSEAGTTASMALGSPLLRLTPGSAEDALAVRPQDLEAAISLWAKTRH